MSIGNKKSRDHPNIKLNKKKESAIAKRSVPALASKSSKTTSRPNYSEPCIPDKKRVSTVNTKKHYVSVKLIPRIQTKRIVIDNHIMEKEYERNSERIPFSMFRVNPYRVFIWGKGSSELPGPEQDYNILLKECLRKNTLFEDTIFPASTDSLVFAEEEQLNSKFIWKRPNAMCLQPFFHKKFTTSMQIDKGLFSNAALIGAFTILARNTDLLNEVILSQSFTGNNYAGIFRFRFWNFNKKIEVVVDDRLPFLDDQLITMQCSEQNIMCFALLEKAYAKLLGSFEALQEVTFPEILKDLTGGIIETYDLPGVPENLLRVLRCSFDAECLISVSSPENRGGKAELSRDGLINGGTLYIVTKILKFVADKRQDTEINLIKFRTTYGKVNWKGPWSKYSTEWNAVSEINRKQLGLLYDETKEFWMTYEESLKHFSKYYICHLNCRYLEHMSSNSKWGLITRCGRWVKGLTAGGGPEEDICMNYQYEMCIAKKTSIILSLSQKMPKKVNSKIRNDYSSIGMSVVQLKDACLLSTPLTQFVLSEFGELAKPAYFWNERDVVVRYELEPGTYYLIPSTLTAGIEGEFLLKVYSNVQFTCERNRNTGSNYFGDYDQELCLLLLEKDCACDAENCHEDDSECPDCSSPSKEVAEQLQNYDSTKFDQNFNCISPVNPNNQKILNEFWALANGNDEVDWTKLNKILKHHFEEIFKKYGGGVCDEVCRNLVAVYDPNKCGKISGQQLNKLCNDLHSWIHIFKMLDVNDNKKLERELWRVAFNSARIGVTTEMLIIIMHRYGNAENSLDFDDFLKAILKLKYYTDNELGGINSISLDADDFLWKNYVNDFVNSQIQSTGISIENFLRMVVPA